MELANEIGAFVATSETDLAVKHEAIIALLTLLAPYAPHIGEHLLERFGFDSSALSFPILDKSALENDTTTFVVQINGKVRGKMDVAKGLDNDTLIALAKGVDGVDKFLTGDIKKAIVVPNKLVSFVV